MTEQFNAVPSNLEVYEDYLQTDAKENWEIGEAVFSRGDYLSINAAAYDSKNDKYYWAHLDGFDEKTQQYNTIDLLTQPMAHNDQETQEHITAVTDVDPLDVDLPDEIRTGLLEITKARLNQAGATLSDQAQEYFIGASNLSVDDLLDPVQNKDILPPSTPLVNEEEDHTPPANTSRTGPEWQVSTTATAQKNGLELSFQVDDFSTDTVYKVELADIENKQGTVNGFSLTKITHDEISEANISELPDNVRKELHNKMEKYTELPGFELTEDTREVILGERAVSQQDIDNGLAAITGEQAPKRARDTEQEDNIVGGFSAQLKELEKALAKTDTSWGERIGNGSTPYNEQDPNPGHSR
ncbi:MAG: hypothetical protein MK052_01190 [Alphaproteobacteria bacterium]|nr:hypothetical protein [Alphaproteobacteria bacterium]